MKTNLPFIKKVLFLLTITFFAAETIVAQQIINTTIRHDGRTRQYRLYVPASYSPNEAAPLVFSFHGFTNTIDIQYDQANFQPLAEANKFIFITPQGINNGWAIENSFGGSQDDLGFTNALIDKMQNDYNINAKRIYATGFSNGGFFSYRLACQLSNRFAAVASIAGSMTPRWIDNNTCNPQHPTPVLQITGTNDPTIPIRGSRAATPIVEVMEYWSAFNNGNSSPQVTQLGGGTTRSIWANGDNGVTAEFISVQGKVHAWNGGNVNTSQEIWDFFSRFDIDGAISQTPPPSETCSGDISSFPYNESFEGNLGSWEQSNSDNINWTIDANGTPSNGTGPSAAVNGNSYIYIETSGNGQGFPNKRAILNSPCINLTGLSEPKLQFSYHMIGNAVGNLTVEARTNNTGDWTSIFSRTGAQGTDWNQAEVALSDYANESSVQLRINAVSGTSWQGDIAIDALSISETIDDTPPPSSCDATVSSFPYNESFEGNLGIWEQATEDDLNWTVDANGTPSNGTGPSSAVNGNSYIYLEVSGNGQGFPDKRAILNSPCFDLSDLDAPTLEFSYHMIGNAVGNLTVEARTNNAGDWTSIFNRSGAQGTDWNEATVSLSDYANESSVQLRINAISGNSWQGDIAIDAFTISETSDDPPSDDCGLIDFSSTQITSFSTNQDNAGDFQVTGGGSSLVLENNTWKQIPLNYVVTANTVLEFEFSSTSQGEIHGLGFENDNTLTANFYFKLDGTQNYGVTNFDNYSGGTTTYTIPVGNFYTGSYDRLVFVNDNDAGSGNNSTFSNVKIYEGSCSGLTARAVVAQLSSKTAILGNEDEGVDIVNMYPNPASDKFSLALGSKSTKEVTVSIYTVLGQKKYEAKLNPGVNTFSASSLSLSSGIYLVQIQPEGDKTIVKKLMIK